MRIRRPPGAARRPERRERGGAGRARRRARDRAGQEYPEETTTLAPGDGVVLYTDGVVEARWEGEQFGVERLDVVLREGAGLPAAELAAAVLERTREFAGGELVDDCAVVVVKRTGTPPPSGCSRDGFPARQGGNCRRAGSSRTGRRPRAAGQPARARRARLHRRRRLARDRDRRLAPPRPVLRQLDDRLGERHRPRARLALARLLARRPARRSEADPRRLGALVVTAAGLDRHRHVRRSPDPRPLGGGARSRLGRSRDRLVLRRPRPLRSARHAPRDGRAVRDPPAITDRRERRAPSRAGSMRFSTVGSLLGTFLSALVDDPGVRHAANAAASAALIAVGRSRAARRPLARSLPAGLAALLLIPPGAVKAQSGLIFEDESATSSSRSSSGTACAASTSTRALATHSVWRRDEVLTGGVWDTYLAVPRRSSADRRSESACSGTPPARLRGPTSATTRSTRVDGVELDPAVSRGWAAGSSVWATSGRSPSTTRTHGRSSGRPTTRTTCHRGRLPPSLRAVLPGDEGVLRARALSASRRAGSSR